MPLRETLHAMLSATSKKSSDSKLLLATTADANVFRELIRESLKCDLNDDFDEIEIEQCHVETLQNWWYGCLGDYCGATLPEGVCAEKCIPPLEEGIALCDGKNLTVRSQTIFWPQHILVQPIRSFLIRDLGRY